MRLSLNGRQQGCYADHTVDDPLEIIDCVLPQRKFYFDESDRVYRPTVGRYRLTRMLYHFYFKYAYAEALEEWNTIKDRLYFPRLKTSGELMPAVLVIGHGDHVYFMHDEYRDLIKIGVSKQLITRFHSIRTSFGRSQIKILRVIGDGGYALEKALHEHFGHVRVRPRGEWFSNHASIHAFIEALDRGSSAWDLLRAQALVDNEDGSVVHLEHQGAT